MFAPADNGRLALITLREVGRPLRILSNGKSLPTSPIPSFAYVESEPVVHRVEPVRLLNEIEGGNVPAVHRRDAVLAMFAF